MGLRLTELPSMCEKCFTAVSSFYSTTERAKLVENQDRVGHEALNKKRQQNSKETLETNLLWLLIPTQLLANQHTVLPEGLGQGSGSRGLVSKGKKNVRIGQWTGVRFYGAFSWEVAMKTYYVLGTSWIGWWIFKIISPKWLWWLSLDKIFSYLSWLFFK